MAVCGARLRRLTPTLVLLACAAALLGNIPRRRRCPAGSVLVDRAFCIDVFEASLVEVLPRNRTRAWSPYATPAVGGRYRAVSRRGGVPQGYVSQVQARAACAAAGKRLCREAEWVRACKGRRRRPGRMVRGMYRGAATMAAWGPCRDSLALATSFTPRR